MDDMKMGLTKDEMDFVIQLLDKRDTSPRISNGSVSSKEEIENNKDVVEKFLDVYLAKSMLISAYEISPDDQNVECEQCNNWKKLAQILSFFIHSIGREHDFENHKYTKKEFETWKKENWIDK